MLSTAPAVDQLRKAASALRRARRRGLPVPGYEGVVETSQGAAVLQQRLPGRTPDRVDDALIDQMLNVNDRFRGLLASRCYLHAPDLYLTASGPGFCVHELLQRYSGRSRVLLDWVRRVGAVEGSTATLQISCIWTSTRERSWSTATGN